MAGNPYTESGEKFRIPDMLANRADTYNLGDVIGGREAAFHMSYLENALTSNATLNPLAGRSSASIEKLALCVRPWDETTELRLLTQGSAVRPLEGYEIFAKKPLPANPDVKNTSELLGRTDWRGGILVPPGEQLLRLIYVKNGSHLLARLPIVPGHLTQLSVELPSDDKRLEAEAFVKGMESTVMDLVARREIVEEEDLVEVLESRPGQPLHRGADTGDHRGAIIFDIFKKKRRATLLFV